MGMIPQRFSLRSILFSLSYILISDLFYSLSLVFVRSLLCCFLRYRIYPSKTLIAFSERSQTFSYSSLHRPSAYPTKLNVFLKVEASISLRNIGRTRNSCTPQL